MVEIPEDSLMQWKKSKEKVLKRQDKILIKEIQFTEIERKYKEVIIEKQLMILFFCIERYAVNAY